MTEEQEGACQKFLRSRKCFTCPVLHIRMLKTECLTRQERQPKLVTTGRGSILRFNNPEDHYCRAKDGRGATLCPTGAQLKRESKGKKP